MNMNVWMLNSCQRLNTKHIHTHEQRGPLPHTHSCMDSFINNMSNSGWLFIATVALHIPVLGQDSANEACRREEDRSKPQSSTADQEWAEDRLTKGCVSLVIGSLLDLNTVNRCLPEPWAMERPTVEEFTLCAVVSLFSATLAADTLLDSIAVYIMYYTSRSNSAACKLEHNKLL